MPSLQTLSQTRTVLLAEDEPVTRRALQAALVGMGFEVHPASDGDEGCALIDDLDGKRPDLLITDLDMPGCCGEDLAEYARQHFQHIKLLFISGTQHPSLIKTIASDASARFLGKPFRATELRAAIRDLGVD